MVKNNELKLEIVTHADRVVSFQRDIAELNLVDVIRKHITTGDPATLDPATYFELRSRIAGRYQLHPNQVIVVGSSRMGFSLKPEKRFTERTPKDVDIAVVSEPLFNEYWDMIFEQVRHNRQWATSSRRNQRFVRCLFAGWITPEELEPIPSFRPAREWAEFFDELTRKRICGIRRINGRLYRSWDRLEAYQEIYVAACKRELERGVE